MNNLSPTIGFDIDRGDRATRMRELSVKFVEWGYEMAAPVLFAFEKYMSGNPGDDVPELEHVEGLPPGVIKIMAGELLQMIEHQKTNAKRAYEKSATNRQAAQKRWSGHNANAQANNANAQANNANAPRIEKEKEEDKDPEGISLYSSSLTCPTSSVGSESQLPSAGACAGARPAAVESGHAMRTATVAEWVDRSAKTFDEGDLRERPVQFVLDMGIDEDENRARPFYMKALQQLGPDIYANTCWRFVEAYVAAANDYGKTMRELEANWDANEAKYTAQGETWDSIIAKAEYKNWHCIKTEREYYEKHSVGGGRILAGMLKEAGLAHGIDIGAKPTKKGGAE